jgi:hypothetical protein
VVFVYWRHEAEPDRLRRWVSRAALKESVMPLRRALTAALVLALAAPPAGAVLLSKRFELKTGVLLEIGATTPGGARLDTVRFLVPVPVEGKHRRTGGEVKAEVAVSNTGTAPLQVGLAIAIHDKEERLVGVASGGTGLIPIPPGRQKTFDLVFQDVNDDAPAATTFQISLEQK